MDLAGLERRICAEAWTSGEAGATHRELCLTYRGRFSASPDAVAAAEFIETKLKQYGLETAHREWFPMTQWTRGRSCLTLPELRNLELPCIALPYAPACDTVFELVDAGAGHPEDLARIEGGIRGKAVLIDDRNPPSGPHYHRLHKYLFALEAGAGAFLFAHTAPGMLPPTGSLAFNHSKPLNQTIPSVGLASEVAAELREWARRSPVSIRLTLDNTLARGRDCNVVADLKGKKASDRLVIICGHYDGHDIAQGAGDNASGTAAVIEAARLLAPLKDSLKCTIRFVLFGSEEMGLVGSHCMADRLASTPEPIRFIFNLDCVGSNGRLTFMLQNCSELESFFLAQAADMHSDIRINTHVVPFSDHFPFVMLGYPAAFVATAGDGTRGWGHTSADTFEKVSAETLMKVGMHTARMALRTAQTRKWPVRPKKPGRIEQLLKKHHMKELLEFEGHWPF